MMSPEKYATYQVRVGSLSLKEIDQAISALRLAARANEKNRSLFSDEMNERRVVEAAEMDALADKLGAL